MALQPIPFAGSDAVASKSFAQAVSRITGGLPVAGQDGNYMVRCTAHDDHHPSLSVKYHEGVPLVHCFAGCSQDAVFQSLIHKGVLPDYRLSKNGARSTLNARDGKVATKKHAKKPKPAPDAHHVFSDEKRPSWITGQFTNRHSGEPFQCTAHWFYQTEDDMLIGAVARYDRPNSAGTGTEKLFLPFFMPNKNYGFSSGFVASKLRLLFHLHQIVSHPDADVWVTEGEQDAAALSTIVDVATTSSGGANSAARTDWTPVKGRRIIIWPDADRAGHHYARQVAELCKSNKAASVRFVDLVKLHRQRPIESGWGAADWVREGACDLPDIPLTDHPEPFDPAPKASGTTAPTPDTSSTTRRKAAFKRSSLHTEINAPDCNDKGITKATPTTALYLLQELQLDLWMNDFTNNIYIGEKEFQEIDTNEILLMINAEFKVTFSVSMIYDAICVYANRHSFHPVRDYLRGLAWDGEPRINHFLDDVFGCGQDEYTQSAGKNFLLGAVARVMQPGSKMDHMLVLSGKQNLGKSTACQVLCGRDWFTSTLADPASKDFYQILTGHWIVELDELDCFRGARDSAIKSAISTSADTYRPAYGRVTKSFPRQTLFIGTTNEQYFLKDTTGNRRYWPVTVTEVNLDLLRRNRDQFWAEAVYRFDAGENFYEMPEMTREVQEEYREQDAWESLIEGFLLGHSDPQLYEKLDGCPPKSITTLEIMIHLLSFPVERIDRKAETRVGKTLRLLGWQPVQKRLKNPVTNAKGITLIKERRYYPSTEACG